MRCISEVGPEQGLESGADVPRPVAGTDGAFDQLYAQQFGAMVHLATFLTGDPAEAPDLVHDAFVRVHEAWPRVREPRAYLRRAVVNTCSNHRRSAARKRRALERQRQQADAGEAPVPDDLTDLLAALPRRQAAALVLRFYLGLPDREIAQVLRCRAGTVASLVHRGLHTLREELRDG